MVRIKKTPKRATGKPIKDDVIRVRLTTEQKAAIVAAAERDGLELSAWLRQLALRAAGVLPAPDQKRRTT
jgi:uncharacterized protein (DUF1778 family)